MKDEKIKDNGLMNARILESIGQRSAPGDVSVIGNVLRIKLHHHLVLDHLERDQELRALLDQLEADEACGKSLARGERRIEG
jgi:ribosome assembly protein YihI (activator of Der GTPase)